MKKLILVDGYNLIYAIPDLEHLAERDLEAARETLIRELILLSDREPGVFEVVFDAAGAKGPRSNQRRSDSLTVVFTGKGRSADSYIEGRVTELSGGEVGSVTVVTGDYQQQKIASGAGCLRVSSREFASELRLPKETGRRPPSKKPGSPKVPISERIPDDVKEKLRRMQKGA